MSQFTAKQKAEVAKRELAMRERVYARWIQTGRITERESAYQIAAMREIMDDYAKIADAEEAQGRLL